MIGWCSCFVRICIGYKMTGNITMDQESDMLRHLLYLWKWMLMAMLNLYSLIIYWNWYNTFFIVGIHLSIFHYMQTLSLSNFIIIELYVLRSSLNRRLINMWSRRSAIERCPSPWNRKQLCPIVTVYRLVKGNDILLKQILCSKKQNSINIIALRWPVNCYYWA